MLWTIFVILLVLWLLGVVTSYSLGGFIHVLLVRQTSSLAGSRTQFKRVPERGFPGWSR
jgi:hypothetical protein